MRLEHYTDYAKAIAGQWWEPLMADMVRWGLVQGFPDGSLRPDRWGRIQHLDGTASLPFVETCAIQHRVLQGDQLQVIRDRMAAIVYIIFAAGIGSGTWVTQRHVLTNAHVASVRETGAVATGLQVAGNPGAGFAMTARMTPVKVDLWDLDDLALLELDPPAGAEVQPIPLGRAPRQGDTVHALGNPFGQPWDMCQGTIRHTARAVNYWRLPQAVYGLDVPINPGNSGGALLNVRGELVGVPSAGITGANSYTSAVPVDRIREFLARAKVGV